MIPIPVVLTDWFPGAKLRSFSNPTAFPLNVRVPFVISILPLSAAYSAYPSPEYSTFEPVKSIFAFDPVEAAPADPFVIFILLFFAFIFAPS